ncbi:TIGR02266 family protein [Myxococcus qinghaiensis]|uniref:TIGR02266 family protein n=1 Tax=Myxococcus qinghaiensis TaxID=2906758 RepID=UPI0020A70D0E|nr:TIGR02266 family protein [Myxococcus qinghaiensis]MCP3166239.1 TIGR02266 family protein [Myxococcus qinghaiensis]
MTSPPPAARVPPSGPREAELARAESELSAQESRLAEQVTRALADTAALTSRLDGVRAALARAHQEPDADPQVGEQAARLQAARVPSLDVEAARAKALEAREKALEARKRMGTEVQAALRIQQEQTAQVARAVADAEAALKQQVESSAARTRARQEAAARARQAEQAQAAATVKTQGQPPAAPTRASDSAEARRNGRVRMHTSIDMRSDSNFFTGFSMDISEGGVFIATVDAVPRGTQVELDFTLPGGRPIKVTGVVRWVRESNPRMPDLMPGVGVQFTGLPHEVASVISSFVTTRDPMFYPD